MLHRKLSGPLNRLNATLPLQHPLNRDTTTSATGSAIVRPYLALSLIHMQVGLLNRLVLTFWATQPRNSGATMSDNPCKQEQNKNAIEATTVDHFLDRDPTLNRRGAL